MGISHKKLILLSAIVYSFFMCLLLNIFGISLSHEEQFYQWNIVNMPQARKELFQTAFVHLVLFVGCLGIYYWKYERSLRGFSQLREQQSQAQY